LSHVTGRTWSIRGLFALLLALTALILSAVSASAHSYLVASDPSDGALLAKPPAQIVLVFSSAVAPDFTNVEVVEAAGKRYQARSVVIDASLPLVVTVNLPELPVGSYRLSFTTHDRVDLHQTAGSIVFGVGVAPAPVQAVPAPAPARPVEYITRWIGLAGLAGLDGGLLLALFIVPRLAESIARRRVQSVLFLLTLAGALLVLFSSTALIIVQAVTLGPNAGRTLPLLITGTEYGSRWVATALLSSVLAVFLTTLWQRARRDGVPGLGAELRRVGPLALLSTEARAVVLSLVLAGVIAISGHSANAAGLSLADTLLRTAHLTAMGGWAGGVLALTLAVVVLRRAGDRSAAAILQLITAFGPYAAIGLALLAVTGLLLSGQQVASVTALLSTPYGAVLVAKVVGVGLVACIALRHALLTWRGLRPTPGRERAPRGLLLTLGLEAGGALALVLLAAVLGSSAPARGPQFDPAPTAPVATLVTQERDSLLASVSMKPNRAGPNLLSVQVVDTRRPAPAPIESVTIVLERPGNATAPERLPTTRSGDRYDAGTVSMVTGDVRVSVIISRTGLGASVVDVPWRVNAPEMQRAPVVISSQPLAPLVNFGALLLAFLAAIAFGIGFLRSRAATRASRELAQGAKDKPGAPSASPPLRRSSGFLRS
jgi:putative copper export protein/methionine-rich copper-binding protein CopC